ncbi:MAG: ATP-binding cassette domain-containing protein [Planctomycetes bacterium]|nr:ATP-binding cassette domain-containing protein [Planctomycetota bacterium]
MIEVQDLSKSFGPVRALDRVSFTVEEGQILGFLGPNGAGKSTTMRILTGFLPGDGGTVRVAGHDVAKESLQVRRATGYLPEGVPLYPEMRVGEYLRFRARLKGLQRSRKTELIARALESTGVADVERRVIGTLSRGYRQRVGLADALLAEPKVLILDEPTVGLDPEQVRQFRHLLREVGRDRTVILSTHILSEVELVCSHVAIIHRGRIVARDTASSIRRRFGGLERVVAEVAGPLKEVRAALGKDPRVARVSAAAGDTYHRFTLEPAGGEDLRETVFKVVRDGGWLLRELRRESVSLEDAFVDIIGGASGRSPGVEEAR